MFEFWCAAIFSKHFRRRDNLDVLKVAQKELDLMYELSTLKVKAMSAKKSPQAYVIGVLKRKLNL